MILREKVFSKDSLNKNIPNFANRAVMSSDAFVKLICISFAHSTKQLSVHIKRSSHF